MRVPRVLINRTGRAVTATAAALTTLVTIIEAMSGTRVSVHLIVFIVGYITWYLPVVAMFSWWLPALIWSVADKPPRWLLAILVVVGIVPFVFLARMAWRELPDHLADQGFSTFLSVVGVLVIVAAFYFWFWAPKHGNQN